MPVIVAPFLKPLEVDTATALLASNTMSLEFPVTGKILILYEACYHKQVGQLADAAAREVDVVSIVIGRLPPCANMQSWEEACDRHQDKREEQEEILDKIGGLEVPQGALECDCVWYIGDKKEQLSNIALRLAEKSIVSFSPINRCVEIINGQESKEFFERYGGVSRVEDAEIIGILVGSMGLTGSVTKELLTRLQRLIISSGKKFYTFVMGRINEAKLCNFPEIDMYCLISNEDRSIIKPKTFPVPVITPYELELGLGAHDWSTCFLSSTSRAFQECDMETLIAKVEASRPEDPFDEEKGVKDFVESAEACGDSSSMPLIETNTESRLIKSLDSAAAERFAGREFKGMNFEVPEGQDLTIKEGRFGIAANYEANRK